MAKQGNAITFVEGTIEITTIGGTPTSLKLVVNEGSYSFGGTAAEAPGNKVGTMHAPGASKTGIQVNAYVSKVDALNPGDELPFTRLQYVDVELICETLECEGEFLIEKLDVSFGPNKEMVIDANFLCNGKPRTEKLGAVTHS